MKRLIVASAVVLMMASPVMATTPFQDKVMKLLNDIFKMELVTKTKDGQPMAGGDHHFKITKETIKVFKDLKEGDEIIVTSDTDEFKVKKAK